MNEFVVRGAALVVTLFGTVLVGATFPAQEMAASSTLVSRLTTGSQSITLTSSAQGGVDLDGYGGLHAFGGYPLDGSGAPYWAGWDIARSLQLVPGGGGGWEMDGYGGIHAFGGAPAIGGGPYWADWDIARSLVLYPNPTEPGSYQGYVLDGFGGVHFAG